MATTMIHARSGESVTGKRIKEVGAHPAAEEGRACLHIATDGDSLSLFVDEGVALMIRDAAEKAYTELKAWRSAG